MQVRQKSGHFSEVVQVLDCGSQQDEPAFEPPWQVHWPLVHM